MDLEIIRMATYSHGYLNKQIISILWANGIPEQIFLKMQKEYITEILQDISKMKEGEESKNMISYSSSIKHIGSKINKVLKHNSKIDKLMKDEFKDHTI